MAAEFQVAGANTKALFTLKVHRADGMALLAMNWKQNAPPDDFVGFAVEYREPNGDRFYPLKNRLAFPTAGGVLNPDQLSTLQSPIQKFRWVHFPRNADLLGDFTYRVTPVFMGPDDALSYGEAQTVAIELRRETYPGVLNVAFTRGFVASQAFVDFYESAGPISTLLPSNADAGLDFVPTHPKAAKAPGELTASAGEENVKRQHVLNLQHNKVIVVYGPQSRTVACGSTNFSWRG